MFRFLLIFLFLTGCATASHDILPKEQPIAPKPVPTYKYKFGDCARFNPEEMKKQGKKTDGTIMFMLGAKRADPRINRPELYVGLIRHRRIKEPTEFTAIIKVFDRDTDKVECPK